MTINQRIKKLIRCTEKLEGEKTDLEDFREFLRQDIDEESRKAITEVLASNDYRVEKISIGINSKGLYVDLIDVYSKEIRAHYRGRRISSFTEEAIKLEKNIVAIVRKRLSLPDTISVSVEVRESFPGHIGSMI